MEIYRGDGPLFGGWYVRTGGFRPPRKGEKFLSGAIPEAYKAKADLSTPFHILREATREETHCKSCGGRLNR